MPIVPTIRKGRGNGESGKWQIWLNPVEIDYYRFGHLFIMLKAQKRLSRIIKLAGSEPARGDQG